MRLELKHCAVAAYFFCLTTVLAFRKWFCKQRCETLNCSWLIFFFSLFLFLMSFIVLCCSYKWEAIDKDNKVIYTMKLCESSPSTSCGTGTAVCARNLTSNTDRSVGEYRPPLPLRKTSDTGLSLWWQLCSLFGR